jgi:hypothetical protein
MTGGLLQIVTSGKQDIYLTINPQITFFKKVFRRHTNFATELKEINSNQSADYNNIITFNLNIGDVVHRCYFEIELPNLSFSDNFITNTNYLTSKTTKISNYQTQINIWSEYYTNLKGYCDVEIILYRNLYNLLQSENITITLLKDEVNRFNYKNKTNKDSYINKIDEKVYDLINISGYINSINKLITNDETYDTSIYISRLEILETITELYNNMISYLKYYNKKKVDNTNKILELEKTNQINFSYAEYLGHNFFKYVTLEMNGLEVERYDNDILHINQMHYIKPNDMSNYLEMIGHTPKLNNFDNNIKGGQKILVPLIFWFNKDAGASLPLVAMQYSNVNIHAKINDIKKIIAFENYEKMYNELLIVTIENVTGFILNEDLLYSKYNLNVEEKSITYNCDYINDELLSIQFPDLTSSEINTILTNNGSLVNGELVINKEQWIGLMININNSIYSSIASKIGSYYPYINYNQYYSLIPEPKVKLICETVYLDDIERAKFASSKLEYIVEKFNYDIYDIKNRNTFDCELSFNYPCKDILWYIQPQVFIDGITDSGQNISLNFDTYKYFRKDPISLQRLTFSQLDVIFPNVNSNYWINTLSYKYLNNILPEGLYYKSFSLYPEETQPSGVVNLRQIKGKLYRIELNSEFMNEYNSFLETIYKTNTNLIENKKSILLKFITKRYDLFVVYKGQGNLIFDN